MDPSYKTTYRNRKLNPQNLQEKISRQFRNYNLHHQYDFDEILFILDQQCEQSKCDRDVARELFDQSANTQNKATLHQMIFKYVQNLQTSKLCLVRQENGIQRTKQKLNSLKGSKKSYVYLKVIQATVHARYSSIPSFSYKIEPSDIPPVTIVNSLNPILNHEYTLQMETNKFKIIFYESGIQIEQWSWPDSPEAEEEGEYHRNIMAERISFQLKIKYKPINSHPEKKSLQGELNSRFDRFHVEEVAFDKLCDFEPFLDPKLLDRIHKDQNRQSSKLYQLTEKIFQFLPFLRRHVRNLYYMLIALILIECLASLAWGMELIDITVAFYSMGKLYDQGEYDMGMEMLVTIMGLALLIIKSIWGAVIYDKEGPHLVVFLAFAIVFKLICIFLAWIVSVRKDEVPEQRKQAFYDGVDPKALRSAPQLPNEEQDIDIWAY